MPTIEPRRLSTPVLAGALLALIAVVFVIVRATTRDVTDVRAAAVTPQTLVSSVSSTGKVEPIEEFQAYAPAPGVVAKVYVNVGQKVKPGDLLIKMDDSDVVARLATANATLRTAEAAQNDVVQGGSQNERIGLTGDIDRTRLQLQQARNDLAALQQLQQKGAASASEIAAAQQRIATLESTLHGLQARTSDRYSPADKARAAAQLSDARAGLAAAQAGYANANVRSPLAGTVYSIPVAQYDYVPAGENLLDVADLNHIRVRAYFDEPEIGKLAVGQAVKITWEARPNRTWHGHISRTPTTVIAYGTRNVGECLITVDDAKEDLLPNTNVVATVTTSERFNVLSVPREALHTDNGNFVFRIVNGKLVRTPVQVGLVNLTRVEITGGLTEKDTVALNAINNRELTNGLPVKVAE